jgi:hypothetical protein
MIYSTSFRRLWKMIIFPSSGKATARVALSLPLLGEDVDLEQACDHYDDKRLPRLSDYFSPPTCQDRIYLSP